MELLKILFLWSILALSIVDAVVLKKSTTADKLLLNIEHLNIKVNNTNVDISKIQQEYQDIFSDINDIQANGNISNLSFLYIKVAQNIAQIKLNNLKPLLIRMMLEEIFVHKLELVLGTGVFGKNDRELLASLKIELILNKKPLLRAIKESNNELCKMIKYKFRKSFLIKKQLESEKYISDYSCRVINKYQKIQIDAVTSSSFERWNKFLMQQDNKFRLPMKSVKKNTKKYMQYIAELMVYSITPNLGFDDIYTKYMLQIESNEKFIRNYN